MLVLLGICFAGILANRFVWSKLPTVLYVVTLGMVITLPGFPGSETFSAWVGKVNFLALTTPILAYAGVGIGKDINITNGFSFSSTSTFAFLKSRRNVAWVPIPTRERGPRASRSSRGAPRARARAPPPIGRVAGRSR